VRVPALAEPTVSPHVGHRVSSSNRRS
jgi:hypothetical protein